MQRRPANVTGLIKSLSAGSGGDVRTQGVVVVVGARRRESHLCRLFSRQSASLGSDWTSQIKSNKFFFLFSENVSGVPYYVAFETETLFVRGHFVPKGQEMEITEAIERRRRRRRPSVSRTGSEGHYGGCAVKSLTPGSGYSPAIGR